MIKKKSLHTQDTPKRFFFPVKNDREKIKTNHKGK